MVFHVDFPCQDAEVKATEDEGQIVKDVSQVKSKTPSKVSGLVAFAFRCGVTAIVLFCERLLSFFRNWKL